MKQLWIPSNFCSYTSIASLWQFKLTKSYSKSPSASATIHQVKAIQCMSQHPNIVAISRVTVESLYDSFGSFVLSLFTKTKINFFLITQFVYWCSVFLSFNTIAKIDTIIKYYIWRLGGSNRKGLVFLSKMAGKSLLEANTFKYINWHLIDSFPEMILYHNLKM